MIMKIQKKIFALAAIATAMTWGLTSCSDEPDGENFYTFTGEMASDYLKSRSQYSDFATVVERANLMDLLASYGHYTCFVPDNDAFAAYLKKRGLSSLADLTDADCDTIARTHLVNNMYSTMDMNGTQLHDANLMRRYLPTIAGLDENENAVVFLNTRGAHIYYELRDDSVENAIMQPINQVLETSSGSILEVLKDNDKVSLFYNALMATGVGEVIANTDPEDTSWDPRAYEKYHYTSDFWKEVAWVPDTKKTAFTMFVTPDAVLEEKYGIKTLRQLYDKACEFYDVVYPSDVNKEGHKFENLTDSVNPLRRMVEYQILTRYVPGSDKLTPLILNFPGKKLDGTTLGYDEDLLNPIDWYETMLPHTMAKIEMLTVNKYKGSSKLRERYINRRVDAKYPDEAEWNKGQLITENVEPEYEQDALNGHYFYVDDIVCFSKNVQEKIHNMRIRMDFATIFPELMTNDMRQKGNPTVDDASGTADEAASPKNGKNYYFPDGYLKHIKLKGNSAFVYRRPHINFWSFEGDEFNIFGDYDFILQLPPVPFSGEWQVRLGFCALRTRGVAQIYWGDDPNHMIPQGIPMDMTRFITDSEMLGLTELMPAEDEGKNNAAYDKIRSDNESLAESMKAFRNLGIVRGPYGTFHTNGDEKTRWTGNWRTYRRILSQNYQDCSKTYYIRIRVASDGKQGNNNEFMLDYLELVPKTVSVLSGSGQMSDDL